MLAYAIFQRPLKWGVTDEHVLWACRSEETARVAWHPLVESGARLQPTLVVPSAWQVSLRADGAANGGAGA